MATNRQTKQSEFTKKLNDDVENLLSKEAQHKIQDKESQEYKDIQTDRTQITKQQQQLCAYTKEKVQLALKSYNLVDTHLQTLIKDMAMFEKDLDSTFDGMDKLENSGLETTGGQNLTLQIPSASQPSQNMQKSTVSQIQQIPNSVQKSSLTQQHQSLPQNQQAHMQASSQKSALSEVQQQQLLLQQQQQQQLQQQQRQRQQFSMQQRAAQELGRGRRRENFGVIQNNLNMDLNKKMVNDAQPTNSGMSLYQKQQQLQQQQMQDQQQHNQSQLLQQAQPQHQNPAIPFGNQLSQPGGIRPQNIFPDAQKSQRSHHLSQPIDINNPPQKKLQFTFKNPPDPALKESTFEPQEWEVFPKRARAFYLDLRPGRILNRADVNNTLIGNHAELFWPDDKKWYLIEVQGVNVAKNTADILYLSGETETLELEEIIDQGHMTLIT